MGRKTPSGIQRANKPREVRRISFRLTKVNKKKRSIILPDTPRYKSTVMYTERVPIVPFIALVLNPLSAGGCPARRLCKST